MKHRVFVAATAIGAVGAAVFVTRPRYLHWGATDQEAERPLPGDELVPHADLIATRAITIQASADEVWSWIAQMGQERGGLYSYDGLENLVGCEMRSADRIVAEWQDVAVGDSFRLHPDVALEVASVDAGQSMVIRGGVPMGDVAPPYDFTWAFVLEESPDGSTRLLVRERYGYTRWWSPLLVEPVEAVSFVMSQKMLRGVKERAERAARE